MSPTSTELGSQVMAFVTAAAYGDLKSMSGIVDEAAEWEPDGLSMLTYGLCGLALGLVARLAVETGSDVRTMLAEIALRALPLVSFRPPIRQPSAPCIPTANNIRGCGSTRAPRPEKRSGLNRLRVPTSYAG